MHLQHTTKLYLIWHSYSLNLSNLYRYSKGILAGACEKVNSDLGLDGGFLSYIVPTPTTGLWRFSRKLEERETTKPNSKSKFDI